MTSTLLRVERKEYKKFLAGEKSSMSGEKLAKLTNIGFVFNVKAAKAAAANVAAAEEHPSKSDTHNFTSKATKPEAI